LANILQMTKRKLLPGSYETDIEPNKAPI